jgi:hypothetical protein
MRHGLSSQTYMKCHSGKVLLRDLFVIAVQAEESLPAAAAATCSKMLARMNRTAQHSTPLLPVAALQAAATFITLSWPIPHTCRNRHPQLEQLLQA